MAYDPSHANIRGSAKDRRVRKQWLLDTFGNGTICFCQFHGCKEELTFDTLTVDRYPIAGVDGGRYVRGNIRPACMSCNVEDGGYKGAEQKKKKSK